MNVTIVKYQAADAAEASLIAASVPKPHLCKRLGTAVVVAALGDFQAFGEGVMRPYEHLWVEPTASDGIVVGVMLKSILLVEEI
ncbi:hypothetical protein VPHD508_0099 [Vibrio phage D508]